VTILRFYKVTQKELLRSSRNQLQPLGFFMAFSSLALQFFSQLPDLGLMISGGY